MNSDTRRMPIRTIKVAGIPQHATLEQCYFPINYNQIKDLEESLGIRIEMLNLSKKAEDAAKFVFQEMLWQWFYDAQDNSVTSFEGCIAPIIMNNINGLVEEGKAPSNRWGWTDEKAYLEAHKGEGVSQVAPTTE